MFSNICDYYFKYRNMIQLNGLDQIYINNRRMNKIYRDKFSKIDKFKVYGEKV